jgi:hypothetical protein
MGEQARGGVYRACVPSHGRCRISLILPETMSDGGAYDMILRRASPVPPLREPEGPTGIGRCRARYRNARSGDAVDTQVTRMHDRNSLLASCGVLREISI